MNPGERTLSAYVHVPYCLRRCGYCDFNTYSNLNIGPGVGGYADAVLREIQLYTPGLAEVGERPLVSVFFGGGTPTVLPAPDLVRILRGLDAAFGIVPGAEVTTEANPDSVTAADLEVLAAGGFTRVSFGMQSAVGHVLRTLDRTHNQAHLVAGVRAAQALGLECSVDLIYGTPGESRDDWRRSLEAVLDLGVKHVSCYALVIEDGTPLGRALEHGEIAAVDPDDQADKYELADEMLNAAGLRWYEISNWAVPGHECQHNLNYWRNQDWFGFGPGAHSHLENVRFWNLKYPAKWQAALRNGQPPVEDREVIAGETDWLEQVLLNIRTREGLDLGATRESMAASLTKAQTPNRLTQVARELAEEGLLQHEAIETKNRAVLTRRGRLLADTVIQRLTDL